MRWEADAKALTATSPAPSVLMLSRRRSTKPQPARPCRSKGAYVRLILRATSDQPRRLTHFRRSPKIFDHAQDRLDDEARAPNSTGAPSLVRRRSLAVSLKGPNEVTSLICAAGVTMAPSLAVA